jgi:hypothetical protein
MVCEFYSKDKSRGCSLCDETSYTCIKSYDLEHCGNYRYLKDKEEARN